MYFLFLLKWTFAPKLLLKVLGMDKGPLKFWAQCSWKLLKKNLYSLSRPEHGSQICSECQRTEWFGCGTVLCLCLSLSFSVAFWISLLKSYLLICLFTLKLSRRVLRIYTSEKLLACGEVGLGCSSAQLTAVVQRPWIWSLAAQK